MAGLRKVMLFHILNDKLLVVLFVEQLLGHFDALVYTNRHNLPKKVAVKMSNIGLCYNLSDDESFDNSNFNGQYADGLLEIE